MIATVQKWGNSLGLRIPKPLAHDALLKEGVAVEMRVQNGQLVVRAQKSPQYTLSALLKTVTRKNLHKEIQAGEPLGNEAW